VVILGKYKILYFFVLSTLTMETMPQQKERKKFVEYAISQTKKATRL